MDEVVNGYPSLQAYGRMAQEYNNRAFTYSEDALPAISGVLSLFSRKFEGGFLCGLPEMYFEATLTWGSWLGDLTRRRSSGRQDANVPVDCLPSWS
jgi:hypothetical protein